MVGNKKDHRLRGIALAAVVLAAVCVANYSSIEARVPTPIQPVPPGLFVLLSPIPTERVEPLPFDVLPTAQPQPTPSPAPAAPKPRAVPKPRPVVKPHPVIRPSRHSVRGRASWYCRAGISVCHHSYPPNTMSAAACGQLRAAIGPNWRGKIVTVTSGGRSVRVQLIDYCASRDKLIDLYYVAMRRLGGGGVLPVTVRW